MASQVLSDAGTGATIGALAGPEGALIGGALGAGVGLVSGFFQKKKANALLKQNPYPTQAIPVDELANQQQAERMADEGTPSAQYQQAQKNIQQNQAQAIASQQDRRMGGANVGAIQAQSNAASGNLDAQSALTRRQNQLNLQTVNSGVADARQKAFDWNGKGKYLQNYQYGMSLLGQGNANIVGGADKLLGSFTQGAASGLFGGNKTPGPAAPTINGYSENTQGLQDTGAQGYQQGNNTDIIMDPNSYSSSALIR
jgi:hypothetical protein